MGSQLNIKSDDAYRLASELAALTGESLTAAVTAALQERLDRKRQALMADARDPKALANRILEIGASLRRTYGGSGEQRGYQ